MSEKEYQFLLFSFSLAFISSPHSHILCAVAFAGARATGECLRDDLTLATLLAINDFFAPKVTSLSAYGQYLGAVLSIASCCSPFCKKAKQAIFSLVPPDEVEVVEVNDTAYRAWLSRRSCLGSPLLPSPQRAGNRICCLLPLLLSLHGAGG